MSRCDQVNAFLSTFGSYKAKDKSRMAYEIKATDKIDVFGLETFTSIQTEKAVINFHKEAGSDVLAGDFIEIIQWPNCIVHWPRDQFIAQNVNPADTVINRGDAVLEQHYESHLTTAGTVIKVGSRYFIEIKNNKVMTAFYINGATRYGRVIDEDKKRNKALAELEARKKKPQLLEVGFWSREVTEVQGGVL